MKGNNVLKINQATMIDMVQHYLNDHVLSKEHQVKVTSVSSVALEGMERVFTVNTSEPETEKPNSGSTGS